MSEQIVNPPAPSVHDFKALDDQKVNISDIANNLTTTSSGKVLDATQGKLLNDHIKIQNSTAWKTYPGAVGRYCYYYEGANTTTYDLPTPHCFVVVEWFTSTRGIAIAYKWANASGNTWVNSLHDTWKGWEKLIISNDIPSTSVTTPTSLSNCTVSAGGYCKIGKLVIINMRINTTGAAARAGAFPKPLVQNSTNAVIGFCGYGVSPDTVIPMYISYDGVLSIPSSVSYRGSIAIAATYVSE